MRAENNGKVKMWTEGIPVEKEALAQIERVSNMPFIHKHVAVMPDVHVGKGATVGTVMATKKAIIPAAVGVDIGCGMMAFRTNLCANDLPDSLERTRAAIERLVPVGMGMHRQDRAVSLDTWADKYPQLVHKHVGRQVGTLGGGNHFIELCLDENQDVWVMLHSGSRGQGNLIGQFFIEKAKREMERWFIQLPDKDLAYLPEGSEYYADYIRAVSWAQDYAQLNRDRMADLVEDAIAMTIPGYQRGWTEFATSCHHNYISMENHFGENVWVTRKGAVRAREGEWGIIPGSMGTKSYIVQGLGNKESFCSCSHGAGRVMSRAAARRQISLEEHENSLRGIACNKTASTLDESPMAYKDIDAVMAAQQDLVEIKYTLKQVLCVKG